MINQLIAGFNVIGAAMALFAIGTIGFRFKLRPIPKDMSFLVLALLSLGAFNCISNIFEWAGISSVLDYLEDFFRLIEPMLFGNIFYAFFMHLSRQDVEESEQKYRLLVENQSDMVIRTDAEGSFLFVSPSYCRTFGKTEEELLGRSFIPMVHPDDLATTLERMQILKEPPYTCYVEQRSKTIRGWRWLAWADKAILDASGNIEAIVAVGRDITDRKNAEDEKELLLRVLEVKNKELESIVYAASHDLRSPLVNIRGFGGELKLACKSLEETVASEGNADLKAKLAPMQSDIAESLYFIDASAAKMQALIDGLLEISRIGTTSMMVQPLEMNRILKHIVSSMNYQIQQAGAAVTVEPLPSCRADARMINQVFSNLLDNALKYRDPERPAEIAISGTQDGEVCVYRVKDNGIGIAPEHQKKIFEVFYRLNPGSNGSGEGLGLSIVMRILDRLGGTIQLESQAGKGSTFIVTVPAAEVPE
jgi:PAS domain S-box-containing protein